MKIVISTTVAVLVFSSVVLAQPPRGSVEDPRAARGDSSSPFVSMNGYESHVRALPSFAPDCASPGAHVQESLLETTVHGHYRRSELT